MGQRMKVRKKKNKNAKGTMVRKNSSYSNNKNNKPSNNTVNIGKITYRRNDDN